MTAKRIAVAVAAVCATLSAPSFAAGSDMKALMDLLLKKGVITQQEYDQNIQAAAENEAFKEKRLADDVAKLNKLAEKNKDTGLVMKNGLGIQSADGNFTANLTGRVHMDARSFDSDWTKGKEALVTGIKGGDAFELRRARLGVAGTLYKDTDYLVLMNMTGTNTNNVEEAFLNHRFSPALQFRAGRFKQPFNMEEFATSSNNLDFMQRSYVNQLAPAKQLGFMVHGVPMNGTTYATSVYQNSFDQITAQGSFEYAGRVTANIAEIASIKDTVLHMGLARTDGQYEIAGVVAGSTLATIRDESRGLDLWSYKEGAPTTHSEKVKKTNTGYELAGSYGPFKIQYEYSQANFESFDTSVNTSEGAGKVKTQYLAAVYNLTGESWSDTYKNGGFGGTKPKVNFSPSNGGIGAWQIGVRLSKYDASDLQLVNGTAATGATSDTINPKGKTITYGLNWMWNPNARFMLNYSITDASYAFTPFVGGNVGSQEKVLALRSQFNF